MKKIYKYLAVFVVTCLFQTHVKAQGCVMSSNYPSGTVAISAVSGATTTVTTCNYAGEYSVDSFTATGNYSVTSSVSSDYITITDNANNFLASGVTPLAVSIPSVGIYRIHIATSVACGTLSSCRTTQVIRPQAPCAGPLPSSTVVASVYTLCPGAPVSLSTNTVYAGTGIAYQWQVGLSSFGPFTAIPNATLSTYTGTGTNTTVYVNVVVTCTNDASTATATAAQLTPGVPGVTATTSSTLLCGSSTAVLNLTSVPGVNYQWQNSSTGAAGSFAAIPSGTTSPFTSTNTLPSTWYNAVVSCSANTSFSVTTNTVQVNYSPTPTITISSSSNTYCYPNGPAVTFTAYGASTYTWNPATYVTPVNGSVVATTNLSGPINVSVTGKDALGCIGSSTVLSISFMPGVSVNTITSSSPTLCAGGNATFMAVATDASLAPYCQPLYSTGTSAGDYIGGVTLGNITNTTTGASSPYYTMYPSTITTTLVAGTAYTLTLQPGTYSSSNGLAAWIDYNQNGNLMDSNEKIAQMTINSSYPATGIAVFTVPVNAVNGTTRFRVREVYANSNIDPCNSASYGETEDYIVTIVGGVTPATSYTWSPSVFLTSTNTASTVATTLTASTVYTVNVVNSFGCPAQGTVGINVNTPSITAVSSASNFICVGQSATLTAGGGISYVWNTSATTAVIAVSPTTTTTYTVVGTNSAGCSASSVISQSVSACTGIQKFSSVKTINVYPNPAKGVYNIEVESATVIEVCDLFGKVILSATVEAGNFTLNISEQANGLYLLKTTSNGKVQTTRLVKE